MTARYTNKYLPDQSCLLVAALDVNCRRGGPRYCDLLGWVVD